MNLALCGMMGSGKTTVGRILADRTGKRLVDTDEWIVSRYGPVSEIFARYGEAHFRMLERKAVRGLASLGDGLIVSTGGGLVLDPENVALLKGHARLYYLSASQETLSARVSADGSRPLLQTDDVGARIGELLKRRESVYRSVADRIVETDGKTAEEVALAILSEWEERI